MEETLQLPVNVATLGLLILMLGNLIGLVWGAAIVSHVVKVDLPDQIKAAKAAVRVDIETLSKSLDALVEAIKHLEKSLNGHETRIRVLEDREERRRP